MPRGRRPNLALEPTPSLQAQRNFRARRAEYIASLEERVRTLTVEKDEWRAKYLALKEQLGETDRPGRPPAAATAAIDPNNTKCNPATCKSDCTTTLLPPAQAKVVVAAPIPCSKGSKAAAAAAAAPSISKQEQEAMSVSASEPELQIGDPSKCCFGLMECDADGRIKM